MRTFIVSMMLISAIAIPDFCKEGNKNKPFSYQGHAVCGQFAIAEAINKLAERPT